MNQDQRYHRRQARKRGEWVKAAIKMTKPDDPEYRGVGSIYRDAKSAAWHAFKAHPELREQ